MLILLFLSIETNLVPVKTTDNIPCQIKHFQFIKQVPVLAYHNINKNPPKENLLFISDKKFAVQMKGLYDSGYQTILPNQLVSYYNTGVALPAKSVIICFDDPHKEQYSLAVPTLQQYGFKAVFL